MSWEIELHPEVEFWLKSLSGQDRSKVTDAIEALALRGPLLGRPYVDRVTKSRYFNMKELRPLGSHMRILFAFDPQRQGILLVAGDKTNNWTGWYKTNIPIADHRFDEHIRRIQERL